MCRGSQCRQRRSADRRAHLVLRAAADAARQPMKSLLPRPLATSTRVNLNLVWDEMERMMGADEPTNSAVADNLRNEWLEEQMEVQAGRHSQRES